MVHLWSLTSKAFQCTKGCAKAARIFGWKLSLLAIIAWNAIKIKYSQFSSEWTSCHPSEPSIFSKMVMIWQHSWTAKSDYSRKYSDVILQTLIRDPPKGCKRLQITKAKAKSRFLAFPTVPLLFYPCPHFPPLSHKHKQQQICCLVLLKKMGETLKFWHFWLKTSA